MVFDDKVAPPGSVIPPGLNPTNVVQAVNLNELKGAVLDSREAIRGREVNVKHFGAVGDGVADDTAAIQAAIDFATYDTGEEGTPARLVVYLPAGIYKTTDTLHLGYGTPFATVHIRGDGYKYRAQSFNGTAIVPTQSDRPCINIQGARGSSISDLCLQGQLVTYITAQEFAHVGTDPLQDDTDPANWHDPSLHANQDSRYAPYAAVTIDAYAGTRPATSYPDVTYPAFLGAVAQYNKGISSDILIENCMISGFTVGVAVQPCDADANADFTVIRRCNFEYCKWGISIGNTQSRNVSIDNIKMGVMFCGLTNNQHGRQQGKFQGTIINFSFGGIKLFEMGDLVVSGPLVFTNAYCESTWKLGDVLLASGNETSMRFIGCLFSFHLQESLKRGAPTLILGRSVTGTMADVTFEGCAFGNYSSVCSFGQSYTRFDGCEFTSTDRPASTTITEPYKRYAENFLLGGAVLPRFEGSWYEHKIKRRPYDLDTGAAGGTHSWTSDFFRDTRRNACVPSFVRRIQPSGNNRRSDGLVVPLWQAGFIQNKATLTSLSLSNRTLTIVFSSLPDYQAHLYGVMPGDIVWDDQTGSVFFIRSRVTTTVLAELQNNYRSADGGVTYTTIDAFSTTTGNLYFGNARLYYPSFMIAADLTSGSGVLANASREDGISTFLESEITVGDRLFVDTQQEGIYSESSSAITARDNAAKTITLSGTVSRTLSRRRLPLFVRQGPPNA